MTNPCPCECNSGGFCGGCGHAGCGGRRRTMRPTRDAFAAAHAAQQRNVCQWYAACTNQPAGVVEHPILGWVPTCQRCADKHDLTLHPMCLNCGGGLVYVAEYAAPGYGQSWTCSVCDTSHSKIGSSVSLASDMAHILTEEDVR